MRSVPLLVRPPIPRSRRRATRRHAGTQPGKNQPGKNQAVKNQAGKNQAAGARSSKTSSSQAPSAIPRFATSRLTGIFRHSPTARRAWAAFATLAATATVIAGLGNGLVSCAAHTPNPAATGRPVTAAEAALLAGMRNANREDGHASIRATIGDPATGIHLTGWLDWRRRLVYVSSWGGTLASPGTLMQAMPGLVAVHPAPTAVHPAPPLADQPQISQSRPGQPQASQSHPGMAAVDPYPPPPSQPPHTGWQVRRLGSPDSSPYDTLFLLFMTMVAAAPDNADALAAVGSRFIRHDTIGGVPVEVLVGPALPLRAMPTDPPGTASPPAPSFADLGGQVTYWVDAQSRVHRLRALLAPKLPVEVDFNRGDGTAPEAIEMLGGAPINPRPVTTAEADQLALLRRHDLAHRGGRVTLVLPVAGAPSSTGSGWLDWRHQVAYLSVHGLPNVGQDPNRGTDHGAGRKGTKAPDAQGFDAKGQGASTPASPGAGPGILLWADPAGIATHWAPAGAHPSAGTPPLRPPSTGWIRSAWADRGDAHGASDFDILLGEAVALSGTERDDPHAFLASASWLRADQVDGVPVTVFEIRQSTKSGPPGTGRLRYWVDKKGVVRRLEIRTRAGAFGYLDLTPAPVPKLPNPVSYPAR